ncbi:MAG: lipoyl protein ligase domain-containing protein [bacterium]
MERDRQAFRDFRAGDIPQLRFFQFSQPTFTLGRLDASRRDFSALSYPYEIRPTGGWTVLHGPQDLCYSVIASTKDSLVGGDLITSYQKISLLLQKAFHQLGREVELSQAPSRASILDRAHCFSTPSQCELVLNNKKVSGGAQAREGDIFLQQGVILLSVAEEWRKAYPREALASMTGLNDGFSVPVTAFQVEEAVATAFAAAGAAFEKTWTSVAASGKLEA